MALGPILPALWTTTPRIVVPFAVGRLRGATRAAVPDATFVRMVDDESYWRLLCRYWKLGNAFAIVEQDIVPTRAQIDTLWACPEDWCAHPYEMNGIVSPALGCTKFSATLLERTQGLVAGIISEHRHWQSLDAMIIGELHRRRFTEHVHEPAVRHLHEPEKAEPRRYELTKLKFVGDGTRYLNAIPAADFETWDAEMVAICLESGLYVDVTPARRERAPKIDKIEQPAYVTKFVPFVTGGITSEVKARTAVPLDTVELKPEIITNKEVLRPDKG